MKIQVFTSRSTKEIWLTWRQFVLWLCSLTSKNIFDVLYYNGNHLNFDRNHWSQQINDIRFKVRGTDVDFINCDQFP